ncbi:MAG: hypothetical protein VX589_01410 [Myxococcota bacterium]|nr:hypothetical protein [Myxococcota bacterium]
MTLKLSNNVRNYQTDADGTASATQLYGMSCGARSLLRAATELYHGRALPNVARHAGFASVYDRAFPGRPPSTKLANTSSWESTIYQWTSNPADPMSDPDTWPGNMPSRIITCAAHLGLQAVACRKRGAKLAKLLSVVPEYKDEVPLFVEEEPALIYKLAPNQRLLKCIVGYAGAEQYVGADEGSLRRFVDWVKLTVAATKGDMFMHWIVIRPDGTVYDPAMAGSTNGPNVDTYKRTEKVHGTGLCIRLTGP